MLTKEKTNSKLFKFWIITWLLCNCSFFNIPIINNLLFSVNTYHNKLLVTILSLFSFVIYLAVIQKSGKVITTKLSILIIYLFIFIALVVGIQIIQGNSNVKDILSGAYHYIVLSSFFLLFYSCSISNRSEINKKFIIDAIVLIGTLSAVSNILCYLCLKSSGVTISDVPLYQYVDGSLRLPQSSDVVGLTVVVLAASILNKEREQRISVRKYHLICLFLCIGELLFVAQVRMVILAVAITILSLLYFRSSKKRIWIFLLAIVVSTMLIDYVYDNSISIVHMFLGSGRRFDSAIYRLTEIDHFRKLAFSNYIFGFGFESNSNIVQYSITDIGILGFVFRFGLIGVIWLTLLIIHMVKVVLRNATSYKFGMLVYIFVSFISLNPFDPQRIVLLPFELMILECL